VAQAIGFKQCRRFIGRYLSRCDCALSLELPLAIQRFVVTAPKLFEFISELVKFLLVQRLGIPLFEELPGAEVLQRRRTSTFPGPGRKPNDEAPNSREKIRAAFANIRWSEAT
jgi:hypothetical protein